MANREPKIITEKDEMRIWSRSMRAQGKAIGLVPTMGFLHQGHISLIIEARKHAHLVVVSIYVNPSQFSPSEDLSTYPSDFHGDIHKLMAVPGSVDVVFHPENLYDYGNFDIAKHSVGSDSGAEFRPCLEERCFGHETWVTVERLGKGLCGRSRPVLFRGAATVVSKLFNIIEPDVAVFGKKDYQQWRIIQKMVRDLDFSVKVIGSIIVRDDDGLASSSRNIRLSSDMRQKALSIYRSLLVAKATAENGQKSTSELRDVVIKSVCESGGEVDYAQIVDQESLEEVKEISRPVVFCVAAWFGNVRLIDNMEIDG